MFRRWAVVSVAVLLVTAVLIVGGGFVFRSRPGPRSVDSALKNFRSSSTVASDPSTFVRPAAGVYQVTGHGRETISTPSSSQDDSAVMPVTVQYLDRGCWQWHIDYNTAHWHEYQFCPKDSQLLLTGQENFLSWDLGLLSVTNLGRYTCTPPAPVVVEHPTLGETFTHRCTGTNSAVAGPSVAVGPATVIGTDMLTIGGTRVEAIHQTRLQTLTGAQSGTIHEEWWYDQATGLPLKASRTYRLTTHSPVGEITYTEQGSWQLSSLHAQT